VPARVHSSPKVLQPPSVSQWLRGRKLSCPPETLARYLHQFTRDGIVFSAGRGWYSSLSLPFVLDRQPVSSLVQQLNQTFPLLVYSCWSTEQLRSYGHHLLARFVTFVHTDRDAMLSVFDSLKSHGYDAHLNQRGQFLGTFAITERTVVVRPVSPPSRRQAAYLANFSPRHL
jgi:hypothetical protein